MGGRIKGSRVGCEFVCGGTWVNLHQGKTPPDVNVVCQHLAEASIGRSHCPQVNYIVSLGG